MDFKEKVKAVMPDYLKDLDTLVRIPSVRDNAAAPGKPFGDGPAQALETFLAMAEKDGFRTKNIDGYAGVIEMGDPENPDTFGMLGHVDVVPVGKDWTKEPFALTESDGYLFGRGVIDDKGPTLAAYYAMKLVRDAGIPLKKRVMLVIGTDEESGMECMDYYKAHGEIPKTGFVPDSEFPVIHGEKGGVHITIKGNEKSAVKQLKAGVAPNVVIGQAELLMDDATPEQEQAFAFFLAANGLKGDLERTEEGVLYRVYGTPAHASVPWLGENAAVKLLQFAGAAYEDKVSALLGDILSEWTGRKLDILTDSPQLGFLTVNPGLLDLGPNHQEVLLDIRYPMEITPDEMEARINGVLAGSGLQAEAGFFEAPFYIEPTSELVTTLADIYARNTGDTQSKPFTIGGGTYAKKFPGFVSCGPEMHNGKKCTAQFVGGCHQRDEGIKKSQMEDTIAIYADALASLAA